MKSPIPARLLSAALLLLMAPATWAAGRPADPVSRCPGTIGVDYPWPAYSDSYAVNKFRDQLLYAFNSLYGFEYTGPEEGLVLDGGKRISVPKGWLITMDAMPNGYSVAVAIPPQNGPFSDAAGLLVLLEQKDKIFGNGGAVSYPGNPNENPGGVRLPCSPDDPGARAPAIIIGVPWKGEEGEPM